MAVRQRSPRGEAAGQHFLRSKRLAAGLVAEAAISPGELVVEIGGGTGVLTQALADSGAVVVAIERDPTLATQLRRRFGRYSAVTVIEGDIAGYTWPQQRFSVVANLPFTRSGAVLALVLRDPTIPLEQANVIVQWEFASKHAAVWPSTLRSIHWRAWYDVSIVGRLHRTAFAPPPSVDAAVLQLCRRDRPRVATELGTEYWAFLASAFDGHAPIRRCLRSSFSPLQLNRLAPALGFPLDAQPRDLDAAQWAQLFAWTRGRGA